MKRTLAQTMRSGLALLLALCMVVGLCPATVFAAESDNTIVYVSMGDSMTNGYGLEGYDGESGVVNYAKGTYGNQFAAWLAGYTGAIEDDQVVFTGVNGTVEHRQLAMSGMRAEDLHWALELDYQNQDLIDQLWQNQYDGNNWESVSEKWYGEMGFKTGDYRTWADLVDADYRYADAAAKILSVYNNNAYNSQFFASSYAVNADVVADRVAADPYFPRGNANDRAVMGSAYLQIATEFYQQSVKDADVITLALGNTNFGTYMLNEIMDVVMYDNTDRFVNRYDIEKAYALAELDPELEAEVRKLVAECQVLVEEIFGGLADGDPAKLEALNNIITYCVVSYMVNYIGAVDAILTLNPDVDIIQIALMNAYADEGEGVEGTTLGDIVDILYTPVNAFIAALPTYMQATGSELYEKATFYYAEADSVECMVAVYGNDFYRKDNEAVVYHGLLDGTEGYTANVNSTVRDRFVQEIVGGQTFAMMNQLGIGVATDLTVAEIAAYDMMTPVQKAAYAAADATRAKSIALYLAFENATIQAGKGTVTMDSLAALGDLEGAFAGIIGSVPTNAIAYGLANYLDAAAAVVSAGSGGALTPDAVKALVLGGDAAIYAYIADRSGGQLTAEQVKALYEAADHDAAIYGYVASLSNGYLDAEAVKNLYAAVNAAGSEEAKRAVIYNTVASIANNALLTADVLKNLYETEDQNAAIEAYIAGAVKTQMAADVTVQQIMAATGHATIDELLSCANAYHGSYCSGVQATYQTKLSEAITGYKPLLQTAVAGVDQLWTAVNGVGQLKGVIANVDSLKYAVSSATNLCYLLGLPETLSSAMVGDDTLSGILCMNARCVIGTGIGGHPSQGGHDSVFAAVKSSYENDYTSAKKTLENALYIINEYYDEAYAYAYQYAAENGYIDEAVAAIDDVIAKLMALEVPGTEEFKAEAAAEIAEIIKTLNAAKALLLEADVLDQATLDALMALLNQAGDALEALLPVLAQAGMDVTELYIIPVLIPELLAKLEESGFSGTYMGVNVTDLLAVAIEAYAYSCVAYSCNLPEVVNTVHAINPEAQVVVVGMYNPLAGVTLDLNGTELAIGEYLQYVVDAANVSALAFAMVTEDAVYVDAPAVETVNTKTEMTALQLITEFLANKAANLNPSTKGHAYITEQILNALTIDVVGLLGDADNNGEVNTMDALLVLQYYTGEVSENDLVLGVSDVDGDGIVNTLDALLILQYYTGAISKFPIEN